MNPVAVKSYDFAIEVIGIYKVLTEVKKEYVLSKQFLRSGTAIGALIKEAEHAQSKADFLNKMNVALKEANEVQYWIVLLKQSGYISEEHYTILHTKSVEILRLLISIVKTTKIRLNRQ